MFAAVQFNGPNSVELCRTLANFSELKHSSERAFCQYNSNSYSKLARFLLFSPHPVRFGSFSALLQHSRRGARFATRLPFDSDFDSLPYLAIVWPIQPPHQLKLCRARRRRAALMAQSRKGAESELINLKALKCNCHPKLSSPTLAAPSNLPARACLRGPIASTGSRGRDLDSSPNKQLCAKKHFYCARSDASYSAIIAPTCHFTLSECVYL